MKEVLAMVLLLIPTAWELWDDRDKDVNKALDVFVRCILVLAGAVYPWYIGHGYQASIFLSGAIFFLFFDYLIHIIMLRRRDWFSFLGTTSKIDRIKIWVKAGAWGRFAIRVTVFTTVVVWYILS